MAEADLSDGVVLVVAPDGSVSGTGFAVSGTLLVTCSHVVQECASQARGEPCPEAVEVVFHATGGSRRARMSATATVVAEWWRGCQAGDIAFLRVPGLPERVAALPLGSAGGSSGDEVSAFGYPAAGGVDGLGSTGRVVRPVTESGRPLLQLDSTEITSGFSGGPLWDRQKRRVIGVVTSILRPDRHGRLAATAFATPAEVLQEICPELRISDVCPYVSLNAFGPDDAEFFFGRGRLVQDLVSRLRGGGRFLALLGPSGSGKSSVIRAGLIPALAAGAVPGSRGWGTVVIRPGADPLAELTQAGLGGQSLAGSLDQWRTAAGYQRAVLVIDQFEELLATASAPARSWFVAQLTDLLDGPLPVTVIVVMRHDFYSRLDDGAPALLRWVERGLANILPLDRDEVAEIVAGPAGRVGLDFEEGLVEVIVEEAAEMRAEGGAIPSTILPLVEFALTELWRESHHRGWLTHEAYRALGGISGALAQWADNAYYGLGEQERLIARSVFLDLVHVADEDEQMPDSRQRRDAASLCPAVSDRNAVADVVDELAARRLVVVSGERDGQTAVELIHDALIREWGPLRAWISEERPFRRWLQETGPALGSWLDYVGGGRQGEEPDWLRGRRLVQAEHWLGRRGADLSPDLRGFIEESAAVRDEEADRERRQLAVEHERGQALRVSESLRLASEARQAIRLEPDTAFLVAWEAVLRDRNELTESVFREALSQLLAPVRILRPAPGRSIASFGFIPGPDVVFAATEHGGVDLWDLGGEHVGHFLVPGSAVMTAAAVPDTGLLLTWRRHVLRLHQPDGVVLDELALPGSQVAEPYTWDIGFSMAGAGLCLVHIGGCGWVVGIGRQDGSLRLRHTLTFTSKDAGAEIHGPLRQVWRAHLAPDAHAILTEGSDAAGLWTLDGRLLTVLANPSGVASGAFLAGGRIVTTTPRGAGYLWDPDGGALGEFKSANGSRDLFVSAVTEDGEFFATTVNRSGVTEVWTAAGELSATLAGHRDHAWSGAFSGHGTVLATGGEDWTVRVFDWRRETSLLELHGHEATVNRLAFHPDHPDLLLSGDQHGAARLWTLEPALLPPLRGHRKGLGALALTPVGVLSSSMDGTCRVWQADGPPAELPGEMISWRPAPGPAVTVLTGDSSGAIYVSRVGDSGDVTRSGTVLAGSGRRGVLSPDGTRFLLTTEPSASLYSATGALLGELDGPSPRDGRRTLVGSGFRRDGDALFTAAENGTVWLWGRDGSLTGTFLADRDVPPSLLERRPGAAHTGTPDVIKSVGLDPDGEYIAFGLREKVCFWDWGGRRRREIRPAGYKVFQVEFLPDASRLVTVTDNHSGKPGFVQLWGRDGDLIANLHVANPHPLLRLRFDPESRYFCLNNGAAIRIFDRDGRALGTLEGPRGIHARDVAIRADGALIAGLFSDGLVRIWDVRGRRRSMTLAVGEAVMLLFGADPSRLLAASPDGVIEQYALDIADLFPAAARRAGRELTTEEIARFAIQPPVQLDLSRYA